MPIPHASASRIAPHKGIVSLSCSSTPSASGTPAVATAATNREWIVPCIITISPICARTFPSVSAPPVTGGSCWLPTSKRSQQYVRRSRIGLHASRVAHFVIPPIVSGSADNQRSRCAPARHCPDIRARTNPPGAHARRHRGPERDRPIDRLQVPLDEAAPERQPIRRNLPRSTAKPGDRHYRSRRNARSTLTGAARG